jgi:hypothetical protein
MNRFFRTSLTLVAVAAAVASQALTLNYAGNGSKTPDASGNFSTLSLGNLGDDFGFDKSYTIPSTSTIVLSNQAGTSGLTLQYVGTAVGDRFSGTATATGFGAWSGYTGSNIDVVRNKQVSYTISIQGVVNPVPEPASIAALGVGAAALIRRRRKA